jgi:peroxiredoxin
MGAGSRARAAPARAAAALASQTSGAAVASGTSSAVARPRAGDKAPRFSLKSVDNGEAKTLDNLLKESAPRGVALVFLSCKCPYAAQARQPLGELWKTYGSKVTFVGVNANQNEAHDDIKADAAVSFPFPMLRDEGSKVADLYGAERTPEAFLIDAAGVIRYHGGVADLGDALAALAEGRAVGKPEAKAFGCTIKRKS